MGDAEDVTSKEFIRWSRLHEKRAGHALRGWLIAIFAGAALAAFVYWRAGDDHARRLGHRACPCPAAEERVDVAEAVPPNYEIARVDCAVVVTVGVEHRRRMQRVTPDRIVGRVDDAVVVVIASDADGQHHLVVADFDPPVIAVGH